MGSPEKINGLLAAAKNANDMASFVAAWEGLIDDLVGPGLVPFVKRLVAEQQLVAPDVFRGPEDAAQCSAVTSSLYAQQNASISAVVYACYGSLCYHVVEGHITPSEAATLMTEWFHAYHTEVEKNNFKACGKTEEDIRQMQREENNRQMAKYEQLKAQDRNENGGLDLKLTNSRAAKGLN